MSLKLRNVNLKILLQKKYC